MPVPLIPIAMGLAELFAPKLIKKLAGEDAADVAKQVVNIAKQVTGVSDPTSVMSAIEANPELHLQLKTRMADLEETLAKVDLENTKDARARDIELRKLGFDNTRADKMIIGDIVGLVLSVIALVIFAVVELLIKDASIPGVVWSTFGALSAHFGHGWQQAHNFEFGSSRGSKMKSFFQGDK